MERGTKNVILKTVRRKNRDTLLPLIRRYITEGSYIYSDEWEAYSNLTDEGYVHERVNHSEEFISESGSSQTLKREYGVLLNYPL